MIGPDEVEFTHALDPIGKCTMLTRRRLMHYPPDRARAQPYRSCGMGGDTIAGLA